MKRLICLFALFCLFITAAACAEDYMPLKPTKAMLKSALASGRMLTSTYHFGIDFEENPSADEIESRRREAVQEMLSNLLMYSAVGKVDNGIRLETAMRYGTESASVVYADFSCMLDSSGVSLESSLLEGKRLCFSWDEVLSAAEISPEMLPLLAAAPHGGESLSSGVDADALAKPYLDVLTAFISSIPAETHEDIPEEGIFPAVGQEITWSFTEEQIAALLRSLAVGTNISAVLIAVATFAILYLLGIENWLGLSFSVISGLAAGVIIGQATEYYTSHSYKPTQKISEAGLTGSATVIIKGIGTGMISTCIPVVTIGVAIMLSYLCANGFDMEMTAEALSHGLYGIGIAAVGMLSTLGITLATDAYGPIADNAGGNAEMSELGEEVRHRTDALDALGNTTAATGKGFAIGSAALTALALLASYIEEIKIAMERTGTTLTNLKGEVIAAADATIPDFMNYFQVNLMNPRVLVGAFIGAMAAFLFCGLTMEAVGRAAQKMVEEVRRQFREIKGILDGKATPDYGSCVEISTRAAQHEMIFPSLLAIAIPIIVGIVLGVAGVLGLLVGGLAGGFTLAVFMANAGGAWDNAKKMVEEGNFGGKGSFAHKATIVGDTVGDPFKDTSGPSLNILIKLMSMVSIVMAGLTVAFSC